MSIVTTITAVTARHTCARFVHPCFLSLLEFKLNLVLSNSSLQALIDAPYHECVLKLAQGGQVVVDAKAHLGVCHINHFEA